MGPGGRGKGHDDRNPAARKRLFFGFQFFGYWLLVALYLWFDVFGQDTWTDKFSQDVVNRLFAPAYTDIVAHLSPVGTASSRSQTSVVLVTESTLREMAEPGARPWPEPAFHHAMRLERILHYGPSAVLVDFIFTDPFIGSTASLKRVIAEYDESGVPLLFGGLPVTHRPSEPRREIRTATQAQLPGRPEVGPVTSELATFIEEVSADQAVPVLDIVSLSLQPEDGVVRSYPLSGELQGGRVAPTAAVKLYEVTTGQHLNPDGGAIEILWRGDTDELNGLVFGCDPATAGFLERLFFAVLDPNMLIQDCPAAPTVPALLLTVPKADEEIAERIQGKVVIYGSSIAGQDLYTTPTNLRLPGAYIHAMAFDNLADLKGDYLRRDSALPGGFTLDKTQAELFLVAPVLALLIATYLSMFATLVERGGLLRLITGAVLLMLCTLLVSLGLSVLLLMQFRLAPLNWLGLLLVATPVWAVARQRPIEAGWTRTRAACLWCRDRLRPRSTTP